jgi:hypothetical protein
MTTLSGKFCAEVVVSLVNRCFPKHIERSKADAPNKRCGVYIGVCPLHRLKAFLYFRVAAAVSRSIWA